MTDDRKENKHTRSHWHHTHLSPLFFCRATRKGRLLSSSMHLQVCLLYMIHGQFAGRFGSTQFGFGHHSHKLSFTSVLAFAVLQYNTLALALRVGVGALHEADGGARARHAVPIEQGRVGLQAREEIKLRADGRDPVVLKQAARVAALLWIDARHRIIGQLLSNRTVTPPPSPPPHLHSG